MENNAFKKVHIKSRAWYYFDDIIKLEDFDIDNILIDEKLHVNILIYNISYKTLIDSKHLRIRFSKIDGFIKIYDGTKYLVLLGPEKCGAIYNKIISYKPKKWHHIYFSQYFVKIKVDSYDPLPIEKKLTLHNVVIYIKSVLNKDKNHYY